jgi:hypothetical protein
MSETNVVTIYGASDDLVEIDGCPGADEFGAFQPDDKNLVHASFVLGGQMRIRALYDGCWSFAVGQVDEAILLPDWPVTTTQHDHGYSTLLTIIAPKTAAIIREHDA